MSTFISYATAYQMYEGEKSFSELAPGEQDELIRLAFEPGSDFRDVVVEKRVKKSQAEGLWRLIVFVGHALEDARQIKSFANRNEQDVEAIVAFLSGTRLWLRLEEAFPPFAWLTSRTDYSWEELERIAIGTLSTDEDAPLYEVKNAICKYLARSPTQLQSEVIDRMPYHAFKRTYDEGKLRLFVDKGLCLAVGETGLSKSNLPLLTSTLFTACVLGFIPIGIYFGIWFGLATLLVGIFAKRATTALLVGETRAIALSDKQAYRWLLARKIIWLQYIWDSDK